MYKLKRSTIEDGFNITDYNKLKADVVSGDLQILSYAEFSIADKLKFIHLDAEYCKDVYQIKGKDRNHQFVLIKDQLIYSLVWAGESKGFFLLFRFTFLSFLTPLNFIEKMV